jgi:hypothetical protein
MDPVTIIVTALAVGAAAGLQEGFQDVAKQAITDAYAGLKSLIQRKFNQINLSVIETKPDDKHLQAFVEDQLRQAEVDKDPEVVEQALVVQRTAREQAPDLARAAGVILIDIEAEKDIIFKNIPTDLHAERVKSRTGKIHVEGVGPDAQPDDTPKAEG